MNEKKDKKVHVFEILIFWKYILIFWKYTVILPVSIKSLQIPSLDDIVLGNFTFLN